MTDREAVLTVVGMVLVVVALALIVLVWR